MSDRLQWHRKLTRMAEVARKRKSARTVSDGTEFRSSTQAKATRDLIQYLPLDQREIEYASQSTLLRLTVNYVKIKRIIEELGVESGRRPGIVPLSVFQGFILVLDSSTNIIYASQTITNQIGPTLADTIGESFRSLIHEDDCEMLDELPELLIANRRKEHMFAVRMKTSMSPTIRSKSKRTYKNVLVSAHFKCLKKDSCDPKDMVVLMLCKSEDFIGIPEIYIGAHIQCRLDGQLLNFVKGDPRAPWIMGWSEDQVLGKSPAVFGHPEDTLGNKYEENAKRMEKCVRTGEGFSQFCRIIASWGQWFWYRSLLTPTYGSTGRLKYIVMDLYLCGPAEAPPPQSPQEFPTQRSTITEQEHTMDDVVKLAKQVLQQTKLEEDCQPCYKSLGVDGGIHPYQRPSASSTDSLCTTYVSMDSDPLRPCYQALDSINHREVPETYVQFTNSQNTEALFPTSTDWSPSWDLNWSPTPSCQDSLSTNSSSYHSHNEKVTDPIEDILANF